MRQGDYLVQLSLLACPSLVLLVHDQILDFRWRKLEQAPFSAVTMWWCSPKLVFLNTNFSPAGCLSSLDKRIKTLPLYIKGLCWLKKIERKGYPRPIIDRWNHNSKCSVFNRAILLNPINCSVVLKSEGLKGLNCGLLGKMDDIKSRWTWALWDRPGFYRRSQRRWWRLKLMFDRCCWVIDSSVKLKRCCRSGCRWHHPFKMAAPVTCDYGSFVLGRRGRLRAASWWGWGALKFQKCWDSSSSFLLLAACFGR